MTVWELITELTRFDPETEVKIKIEDEEFETYDVHYDRVYQEPVIIAR